MILENEKGEVIEVPALLLDLKEHRLMCLCRGKLPDKDFLESIFRVTLSCDDFDFWNINFLMSTEKLIFSCCDYDFYEEGIYQKESFHGVLHKDQFILILYIVDRIHNT